MMTDMRRRARLIRAIPRQLLLILLASIMLYPLVIMLVTSLKSNAEVLQNPTGLPWAVTLENFFSTWDQGNFENLFAHSIFLTITSMVAATLIAALASYAIVRRVSRVSSVVYLCLAAGLFLPMQLALIPQFRVIRDLGLINNYASVILVYIAGSLPFGIFLMASFMRQLPAEIVEAAVIDGAGYFMMFRKIYLPLARPAIVSFWVLQGVGIWNNYLVPLLLLPDPEKRTLTTGVLAFKQQYLAQWGNLMAGVVIMSLPVILLFIFAQKYFVSGLYAGSVK